jgi:hypothetical protein
LLGAVAPANAMTERARLEATLAAGRCDQPRWAYVRAEVGDVAEVERLAAELERLAGRDDEPLAAVYARRAEEVALEARLAASAGCDGFGRLARQRFDATRRDAAQAETIARAWMTEPATAPSDLTRTTDGPEPESLLSRMREAVGRERAPFTVDVRRDLASLAATGERTVFVAAGRVVDDEDVRRTVVHEVVAHVLPRTRAARLSPKIFQIGTARGADEQEGFAVLVEERSGLLSSRRKRELAARHLAILAMDSGASFPECATALVQDYALSPREAISVTERAFRGGDGASAGLGRERVYLTSYARVRAHLASRPDDERVLSSGQVALEAVDALRPFMD